MNLENNRHNAMNVALEFLRHQNIDISNFICLDFFAREGDWLTFSYAHKVKKVVAWEIDESFRNNLIKNLPSHSEISISDSFSLIEKENRKFDMIVLDNPQSLYGQNSSYCEHFEAIKLVLKNCKSKSILFFNIKTIPIFKRHDCVEWKNRRDKFYNCDSSNLENDFIEKFYCDFFKSNHYNVLSYKIIPREQEKDLFLACYIIEGKQ